MSGKKKKLCVRYHVLWVPTEEVTNAAKNDFTYRFKEVNYVPDTNLTPQCVNCNLWGKKWRKGQSTCAQKGYTLNDLCRYFAPKEKKEVTEKVVRTYEERDDGWTIFARGDLGKIRTHFKHLGIEDQRVAPELGFDLRCHRTL